MSESARARERERERERERVCVLCSVQFGVRACACEHVRVCSCTYDARACFYMRTHSTWEHILHENTFYLRAHSI